MTVLTCLNPPKGHNPTRQKDNITASIATTESKVSNFVNVSCSLSISLSLPLQRLHISTKSNIPNNPNAKNRLENMPTIVEYIAFKYFSFSQKSLIWLWDWNGSTLYTIHGSQCPLYSYSELMQVNKWCHANSQSVLLLLLLLFYTKQCIYCVPPLHRKHGSGLPKY